MDNIVLEVSNLKKYFKTPHGLLHAVDDVSFKIKESKTIGVVGESGCGKSTLGRTILNLTPSTDGKIIYNNEDITHVSNKKYKELHKEMQMIFQDPYSSLDPRMSIGELIGEPFEIYKQYKSKKDKLQAVSDLMEEVGLSQTLIGSYPHELDGGRRQRIGIARALALGPKFVVCDEPVSALDVSIQAQILNLLQDLQQQHNLTYLFITHNLSVVKHISDEIVVMYLGCVVEHCETDELFEHTLHPYTKALLAAIPSINIDNRKEPIILKGEISSPIDPKPCCRFCDRCESAMDICKKEVPKLHDVGNNHKVACHLYKK